MPHLEHAIQAEPDNSDFLFVRGQTRQHLGDFDGAAADFKLSAAKTPRGIILASLAYCRVINCTFTKTPPIGASARLTPDSTRRRYITISDIA